jgi:hypothetical protein
MAAAALGAVLLAGIRVHPLSVGKTPNALAASDHQHLERQKLRQFAATYFFANRPFTIELVFSTAPLVVEPCDPLLSAHSGGFYVNRPPPTA